MMIGARRRARLTAGRARGHRERRLLAIRAGARHAKCRLSAVVREWLSSHVRARPHVACAPPRSRMP
jgi:hypothetical protein